MRRIRRSTLSWTATSMHASRHSLTRCRSWSANACSSGSCIADRPRGPVTRHGGSDSNTLDTTATDSNPSVETSFTSFTGKFLNRKSISCPVDRGSHNRASPNAVLLVKHLNTTTATTTGGGGETTNMNSSQGSRGSSNTSVGSFSSSSGSNSETAPLLSSSSRPASHSMTHILFFLAGILLNLIYCIFSFVPLLLNDAETRRFHTIYFYYSTFYWTSITRHHFHRILFLHGVPTLPQEAPQPGLHPHVLVHRSLHIRGDSSGRHHPSDAESSLQGRLPTLSRLLHHPGSGLLGFHLLPDSVHISRLAEWWYHRQMDIQLVTARCPCSRRSSST